tara:strand:- start:467 stop:1183 length:717 start_codon:yes stop_codon:yes gene_type:complete
MGYLDNTSVTVDAVLTKKGREILSNPTGRLEITHFTLSDTGVDYTLWNPDHPSGSAFYGEAIENLPQLEASVHAEYSLRNRLITLNQNAISIPALDIQSAGMTTSNRVTITNDKHPTGVTITVALKGFTNANAGDLYFVMGKQGIFNTNARQKQKISGATRTFLPEANIPDAMEYSITQTSSDGNYLFNVSAIIQDQTGKEVNFYVVHGPTGAYNEFVVVNNVDKLERTLLSSATTKG